MAASPEVNAQALLQVAVSSDGVPLPDTVQIISVTVHRAINKVPSLTLVLADGDMSSGTFPLSNSAVFVPGATVVVEAGYGSERKDIFKGIVVRHGLEILRAANAKLIVECRDAAVKMTVGRQSAVFEDKTDSAVMQGLIEDAGLAATVAATSFSHRGLVQHNCTDWDFLVTRAEANGHVVLVRDGSVTVGPPDVESVAALSIAYGSELQEFQADIDARHQFASVTSQAWDISTQALLASAAAAPAALNAQGNLDPARLAQALGARPIVLQAGAPWSRDELDGWSKAQQLKSGLSRLRGRMKFQGSALATVGGQIELKGVSERFNGTVYVTGLTHEIRQGDWSTEAEFGAPAQWFAERTDIQAPPASGLVPGIAGLHAGVVLSLDADPQGLHRVQVAVPSAGIERVWARLLQFQASASFGAFFVPEVGDEVVLGWFDNAPDFPVILGSLYSGKNPPPFPLETGNRTKAIVTRSRARLEFDDEDQTITLTTPGGNQVVFSDKDKSVVIDDQNGNRIELNPDGITLDSPKDIRIKAQGAITLEAVNAVTVKSQADVSTEGLNVNCTAQVGFVARGAASAELSASGQTTVKGAVVLIN
jgi:Rhs element Vgr protein